MVVASESRDGQGAADHNVAYEFGHPRTCLTLMTQARLLVMRGYIRDKRGPIVGDEAFVALSPGGVLIPPWMHWGNDG